MSDRITRLNAALEGRYRVERSIGEGEMATVYLADDLDGVHKLSHRVDRRDGWIQRQPPRRVFPCRR